MTRRAKGEGSIYKRSDGKWCAIPSGCDPATGKRFPTLYGRTKAEVRDKLKAVSARLDSGGPMRDSSMTVAEWLSIWTAQSLEASDRKATTKALYSGLATTHLSPPPFGAIRLDKLRSTDVEALIVSLRDKKLATSSIRQIYTVLRGALDIAVRDHHLAVNPAVVVKRPRVEREEATHLSGDQVRALLRAAETSRYHSVLALIAATGLRRGEALALKWRDVDLDKGRLKVRGTLSRVDGELVVTSPKTQTSRRELPLSPSVVALLKAHRRTQRVERMSAANLWTDTGFVFLTEFGHPCDPRNVLRAFQAAAKRAKVKGASIHTLRHSAATTWLENGVNLKAVSKLLGHSSISITGDIYGHVSEEASQDAMDTLSTAIGL